jgi:hypothetical protein
MKITDDNITHTNEELQEILVVLKDFGKSCVQVGSYHARGLIEEEINANKLGEMQMLKIIELLLGKEIINKIKEKIKK